MTDWPIGEGVQRIARCELRVVAGAWRYAEKNADAIEAHWREASRNNPAYFNGKIYLISAMNLADACAYADLIETDFKSFLHWRSDQFPDANVLDGFGSALIRAQNGDVVIGRQRPGNLNAGLAYLPGGFIDPGDVRADGAIDIEKSIVRELAEETGLIAGQHVSAEPGFYLTRAGWQLSFAVAYRAQASAEELKDRIAAHLASSTDPELEEIVVLRSQKDLLGLAMPPYAQTLLPELLPER
jgi:8-oxo-dGTP pyrophosphatase MutT (NUDIX family)